MNKIALGLFLTFVVLLSGNMISSLAIANPVVGMKPVYAKVSIESPQNDFYNGSDIQLSFTVLTNAFHKGFSNYSDNHCFITLDSKRYEFYGLTEVTRNTISNDNGYNPYTELTLVGNASISNLATGSHSIKIEYGFYYAFPDKNYQIEYIVLGLENVNFSIDSNISGDIQPIISLPTPYPYPTVSIQPIPALTPSPFVPAPSLDIIQPQNFTYSGESAKDIPLMIYATVLVDAPAVVSISYSLDESQNITFTDLLKTGEFPSQSGKAVAYHTEMLSLSDLTDGSHVLKTYSLDASGNVMKNTVEFTVESTPKPTVNPIPQTPQTFPVLIAALIVISVVVAASILFFRRHQNR
jgi:hypothetical protein